MRRRLAACALNPHVLNRSAYLKIGVEGIISQQPFSLGPTEIRVEILRPV